MSELIYQKLRKEIADFEKGLHVNNTTYMGNLFASTPWFTSGMVAKKDFIPVNIVAKKNGPIDLIIPSSLKSEKQEIMESLNLFTSEELKDSNSINIAGGSIVRRKNIDNHEIIELDYLPCKKLSEYMDMLSNCKMCFAEDQTSKAVRPVSDLVEGLKIPLDLLFVGHYPESESSEAHKQRCFGKEKLEIIEKMAKAIEISNGAYSFSLVTKCIPSTDTVDQLNVMGKNCVSNLYREMYFLKPRVVVSFGAFTTNILLGRKEKISAIHGQFLKQTIKFSNNESFTFLIVPIFHPEFLLINPKMKRAAWEDLQKIAEHITQV